MDEEDDEEEEDNFDDLFEEDRIDEPESLNGYSVRFLHGQCPKEGVLLLF